MSGPLRGRSGGRVRGRGESDAQVGRGVRKTVVGVSGHPAPVSAVVVRVFRPGPDDPNRASGEGKDGSDPPFFTAGAVRRAGGCQPRCQAPCQTPPPPSGGVAPVLTYPCWKAPPPASGRDDEQRRAGWFLLAGGGMSSWCGRHGPAVFHGDDPVAVLVHWLTTTRQFAPYRQDGKRPPARSPRQGRRPNRPSADADARTGRIERRPPRSGCGPRAPAPPR